jgi:hypothetical protein
MQNRPQRNDDDETWVLPKDELTARRAEKTQPRGLSAQQIERLLKAAEARKEQLEVRRVKGLLIEEQPVSFLKPRDVPEAG